MCKGSAYFTIITCFLLKITYFLTDVSCWVHLRKVYVFTHWNYVYVQSTLTINTVKPTGHKTLSYLPFFKFKNITA